MFDIDPNDEVILSAADYAQMLDEIKNLHAECDRLTAMLGKPKVLEAHELTELGWYWHKWPLQKEWKVVKVCHTAQAAGQFVGPLKQPEV